MDLTTAERSLILALLANYMVSMGAALKQDAGHLTDAGRARYLADIAEAEALIAKLNDWRVAA